jgi:RHS repeat-associated protein
MRKPGAKRATNLFISSGGVSMARLVANISPFLLSVALSLVAASTMSFAQSTQFGVPTFSSVTGGPETINAGNLGFVYTIPVFSRAGRGSPLSLSQSLQSDSWSQGYNAIPQLLWMPSFRPEGVSGGTGLNSGIGFVSTVRTTHTCANQPGDPSHLLTFYYYNFSYLDGAEISHPFGLTLSTLSSKLNMCADYIHNSSGTAAATDGSGMSISASFGPEGQPEAVITFRDGTVINGAVDGSTSVTSTDSNGNTTSWTQAWNSNTSGLTSFSVTDTLGTTAITANGNSYSYTAPSGATANFTASTTEFTVETAFNCPGVAESSATPYSLVTGYTLPDGSTYTITYESTTPGSGSVTGRIAAVTLPTGGTISYTYKGGDSGTGIFCADGSTSGFDRTTPDGTWQYLRSNYVSNGYCNGTYQNTCLWSSTTTVIDPQGNNTVMNFDLGLEVQRQVYSGAATGTPLETVITCYNGNTTNCGTFTGDIGVVTELNAYTSLNGGPQARVDTFYNSNGLMTARNEYDFGATAPTRQTTITYDTTLGNGVVDKPSQVTVTDGNNNILSQTSYTYDQDEVAGTLAASGASELVAVTCTVSSGKCRGNATTVSSYVAAGNSLTKTFTHYDSGAVYKAADVNGTVASYAYGECGESLLTSVSLPLSLSQSYTWNCTGGVMVSSTDENGKISTTSYTSDPYFWRPNASADPLGFATTYAYTPTSEESTLLFNRNQSALDSLMTVDGLGRKHITQRRQSPGASNFDSTEVDYVPLGRPDRETMPYVGATGQANSTAPATTTQYDGLGRSLKVVDGGGGTTTYSYSLNDVLVTVSPPPSGENPKQRQLEYDSLGRLTSVCEITSVTGSGSCGQSTSATGFLTKYTYDVLNNLLSVTQNAQPNAVGGQQARAYTYDGLKRLTSETNPEWGPGTANYSYDVACGSYLASAGDKTESVDAAGNITCYQYDSLHRLTDSGNSGPTCRHLRYDNNATLPTGVTLSNTLSRMAEARTDNCLSGSNLKVFTDELFSYDADGRVTDVYESTPNSGSPYYHTSACYWPNGTMETLSGIPSVPAVYYGTSNCTNIGSGLDGEGRVTKVTAATGTDPASSITYSAATTTTALPGSLTGVALGSADSDSFNYDPNTGRTVGYTFSINGVNDTGTLTWNKNGTLGTLVISDLLSGSTDTETCNYFYDDLGRLGGKSPKGFSVDCGSSGWQQLFAFDPFGNITKSGSLSFLPIYSEATNRYTSIPGVSVQYDGDGNLKTDNLNTYTWDPNFGSPASVNDTVLIYDALGRMVEEQNGSGFTQILYSPAGKTALMNGQTLVKAFIDLPGGGTTIYTSTGLAYYRHSDWLGSSRLTSSANRTPYSISAYAPFGEQYNVSGTSDPSFTGQNSDTVSSLYDFLYRENSASQGRWISPDPAGLSAIDPTDPQSWNRYAYVGNDPLSRTDLGGLIYLGGHYFNLTAAQINCKSLSGPAICGPQSWNEFDLIALVYGPGQLGVVTSKLNGVPVGQTATYYGGNASLLNLITSGDTIAATPPSSPPCRIVDPVLGALELTLKFGPELQLGPVKAGASFYKNVTTGGTGAKLEASYGLGGVEVDHPTPEGGSLNSGSPRDNRYSISFLGFQYSFNSGTITFDPSKSFKLGAQILVGGEVSLNPDAFKQISNANTACRAQGGR